MDNLYLQGVKSRTLSKTTSLPKVRESRSHKPRVLSLPASFRMSTIFLLLQLKLTISSQEQLSKLLQLVIDSDTLKASGGPNTRTARLGAEGSRVLENVKNVLSASKAWGDEKNGDDLIQNFFVC
jgi:hypothetical protein